MRAVMQHKGIDVVVADRALGFDHLWLAVWGYDRGEVTIYLETAYYDAIVAADRRDILLEVLEHERLEAEIALSAAKARLPETSPGFQRVLDEEAGRAHVEVIRRMHRMTEQQYSRRLDEELYELGLFKRP